VLFNSTFAVSQKYDGTNVGKDEFGVLYGRNMTLPSGSVEYQKTPLDFVNKVDVKAIKEDILKQTGLGEEMIKCFNLYGELMCNSYLYNYEKDKVHGTYQLFGAII